MDRRRSRVEDVNETLQVRFSRTELVAFFREILVGVEVRLRSGLLHSGDAESQVGEITARHTLLEEGSVLIVTQIAVRCEVIAILKDRSLLKRARVWQQSDEVSGHEDRIFVPQQNAGDGVGCFDVNVG